MSQGTTDQWQCSRRLPECLQYMFDHQIACDVKFLMGKERQEIHAHRFVLMSRSPVFYSMLEGPIAEKGDIVIEDVEKESFNDFLRFLYTDEYLPSPQKAISVLYCAKKYCVDLLSTECLDYLEKSITPENVCAILEAAHCFDNTSVQNKCLQTFIDKTSDCIGDENFKDLSKECLHLILELDEITAKEEEIYAAVIKWAESECTRRELEQCSGSQRAVLGDLIYGIRFPAMDPVFFSRHIANTDLLTDQEKVSVFTSFHLPENQADVKFKPKKRQAVTVELRRFGSVDQPWGAGKFVDKIGFELSHQSILHGVLVYGIEQRCNETNVCYKVAVKDRQSGSLLIELEKSISTSPGSDSYKILFEQALMLKPQHRYTIEMTIVSPSSMKYGKEGKQSVTYCENKTISFFSECGSSHTNVTEGQIPGLIVS